jgi:hypothetical protein
MSAGTCGSGNLASRNEIIGTAAVIAVTRVTETAAADAGATPNNSATAAISAPSPAATAAEANHATAQGTSTAATAQ